MNKNKRKRMLTALDRSAKALISLPSVAHKLPREPTKKDLNRRFVMPIGREGKPTMREIKDGNYILIAPRI